MNWEEVKADWVRLGPLLKSKWGKLTEHDLASSADKRELLIAALERHYGIHKKHAELQLDRWVLELKPAPQTEATDRPPAGKAS